MSDSARLGLKPVPQSAFPFQSLRESVKNRVGSPAPEAVHQASRVRYSCESYFLSQENIFWCSFMCSSLKVEVGCYLIYAGRFASHIRLPAILRIFAFLKSFWMLAMKNVLTLSIRRSKILLRR